MTTHQGAPMTGPAKTADEVFAIICDETKDDAPQNDATVAFLSDPENEEKAVRVYLTTMDEVRTELRLITALKPYIERLRGKASAERIARYSQNDGPLAA